MKAVVIGALAATAFSATSPFSGVYTVASKDNTVDCCYPAGNIKVTQQVPGATGDVGISFSFDSTSTCQSSPDVTGTSVAKTATPSSGTVTFPINANDNVVLKTASGVKLETTDITKSTTTGYTCIATLQKNPGTWTQAGLYEVDTKSGTDCCFPAGDIEIEGTSTVSLTWTFDSTTTGCATEALRGDKVTGTADADPNNGDVYFTTADGKAYTLSAPTDPTSKAYTLDLKSASKLGTSACSVVLKTKKLPEHTYTRLYDVSDTVGASSKKCCYPDDNGVKVTQDSTTKKVSVSWKFENNDDCYSSDLKNKEISGEALPSSVTGDVTFTDEGKSWKLDYPSTTSGAWSLDLSSIADGCAATLEESKSGYLVGLGSLVALSLSYIMF